MHNLQTMHTCAPTITPLIVLEMLHILPILKICVGLVC